MFKDISHLFLNTKPVNRQKAADAMKAFYRHCGQDTPEIVFVNGPKQMAELIDPEEEGFSFFDRTPVAHFVTRRGVGKLDRVMAAIKSLFWQFRRPKKLDGKLLGSSALLVPEDYLYGGKDEWDKHATAVWDESYVTVNFKKRSFIVDRPQTIRHNARGLHCSDGPAVVFRDGSEFFFWNSTKVTEGQLLCPESVTLKEIHDRDDKHMMIAMVGVDRYLDLVKNWDPDVKGKFANFFGFGELVVAGDDDIKENFNKQGDAWMYEKTPHVVDFSSGQIDDTRGVIAKYRKFNQMYMVGRNQDVMGTSLGRHLTTLDKELWDLLAIKDMLLNSSSPRMTLWFKRGEFGLKFGKWKNSVTPPCRRKAAPAWFRAKMFLGEDAFYETDKYAVRWTREKGLEFAGDIDERSLLFSGNEDLPQVHFDVKLKSGTWEGLLDQWARLSFEWIKMST